MIHFVLCALLASPSPLCTTSCGMIVSAPECSYWSAREAKVNKRLSVLPTFKGHELCGKLEGWRLDFHGPDAAKCASGWQEVEGMCVIGFTYKFMRTITLMTSRDPRTDAYSHEMVHALEGVVHNKVDHCRWARSGVKRALLDLEGRADNTPPDATCPDAKALSK